MIRRGTYAGRAVKNGNGQGERQEVLDGDRTGNPQIQEDKEYDPGGDGGQAGGQRAGGK